MTLLKEEWQDESLDPKYRDELASETDLESQNAMVSQQLEEWMHDAQREEFLGMGYEVQQMMSMLKVRELSACYGNEALNSPCLRVRRILTRR